MHNIQRILQGALLLSTLLIAALIGGTMSGDWGKTQLVVESGTGSTGSGIAIEEGGGESTPSPVDANHFPEIMRISRIEPPMSYPGGEITFEIFVTDPDGIDDINTVTVNLFPLKGPRVKLVKKEEEEGGGAWYERTITIPDDTKTGTYTFELLATDALGKSGFAKRSVSIVSSKEKVRLNLRKPTIELISTEPEALDVGITEEMYIYAQIRDEDGVEDIVSVVIDLEDLGREGRRNMVKVEDMNRFTARYGFKIKDTDYLAPTRTTYEVQITAYDESSTTDQKIYTLPIAPPEEEEILEGADGGAGEGGESSAPKEKQLSAADVAVGVVEEDIIELTLPEPLHVPSFRSSGADIQLTSQANVHKQLPVSRALLSGNGKVIRIFTDGLIEGRSYAVWLEAGVPLADGSRLYFNEKPVFTYKKGDRLPLVLQRTEGVDHETVDLYLSKDIQMTSVLPQGGNCRVFGGFGGTVAPISVSDVEVKSGKQLRLHLGERLDAGTYTFECTQLRETFSNTDAPLRIHGRFTIGTGDFLGDLNGDGTVSFHDFTLFTKDYAQALMEK